MYLLDTNICIYIIKKSSPHLLKKLKSKLKKQIFISSITIAELEHGIAKSKFPEQNKVALLEFISIFTLLNFDDSDAVEFGKIKAALEKRGEIIGPMDLLLAAQARAKNLVLVTNNTREFRRVDSLKIEDWTSSGTK